MAKIVFFSDDPERANPLAEKLSREGNSVSRFGARVIDVEASIQADLIVISIKTGEAQLLDLVKARFPKVPILVASERIDASFAISMMKGGAVDVLKTPTGGGELQDAVDLASQKQNEKTVESHREHALGNLDFPIIGNSRKMLEVYKEIGRVAATDATVLISGETGTGKELVARAVHANSRRRDKKLVTLNCAAIPANLLESQLFGHEKGAFTGAAYQRIGKFEQAHGGTIFLDEIGELTLESQAKLLRALEYKRIEHLGGNKTIEVDARIVAATNRELPEDVANGLFREDLYHRLNVLLIHVPPLRERRDDIPKLLDFFMSKIIRENQVEQPQLTQPALDLLCQYDWPGNVRELENCIKRAVILSGGYTILKDDVESILRQQKPSKPANSGEESIDEIFRRLAREVLHEGSHSSMRDFAGRAEEVILQEALIATNGNQTKAAQILGISRPSVQAKMKKYGVKIRGTVDKSII